MEFEPLLALILENNPNADAALIRKAFDYARENHKDQKRVSDEPYFTHPYEVVRTLASLGAQSATLCAGFLHDVVEDSSVGIDDIREEFGDEIADLVEGVTKIDKIHFETKADYTAENLRKVLLATAKDVRVMLIKLADRLHNMQTLKYMRPEKQKAIAQETMDIYAPIAHKLGIWRIKGELEDLSMRYLLPDTYRLISEKINEKRAVREKATENIIKMLQESIEGKGLKAHVTGRAKYFYSIYKKMKKKNVDLDEIYDLIAVRIVVDSIPECYQVLGTVHELWKPMARRFKDYISSPKANGYQSLHTVLEGPNNKVIEVQIRTWDMDHIAEDGIAAHWKYHGTERDKRFDKRISWIKQLLSWRNDSTEAKRFIETLKMDLFEDEIITFTPKGDPINLREGSTPVDFAFEVHTYLGLKCAKAIVNGKLVPLDYKLQPGDVVEIITQKNSEPSRQWLSFVMTGKAKGKIRSHLNITLDGKSPDKSQKEKPQKRLDDFVEVEGKKAQAKFSKCCNPKYGDPIRAFLTKDKKITIHTSGCDNIHALGKEREVKVRWKVDKEADKLTIEIIMKDKVGMLADILNFFAARNINISKIQAKPSKEKTSHTVIELQSYKDKKELLLQELRTMQGVINVNERL